MGRAARNSNGQVLLYSDDMSPAMEASIRQTLERRARQETHNKENGITPQTIQKALPEMGQESSELIAGTNTSKDGKKRLVSRKGGRADGEFASRLNLSSAFGQDIPKKIKIQLKNQILNWNFIYLRSLQL